MLVTQVHKVSTSGQGDTQDITNAVAHAVAQSGLNGGVVTVVVPFHRWQAAARHVAADRARGVGHEGETPRAGPANQVLLQPRRLAICTRKRAIDARRAGMCCVVNCRRMYSGPPPEAT